MVHATPVSTGKLESVDNFLKEAGATPGEPLPRLTVTHSSLPDEAQVFVLDYKH